MSIPTVGQIWPDGAGTGGGSANLDALTDVVISTPTTSQVLQYNGSQWVNATVTTSGGGGGTGVSAGSIVVAASDATAEQKAAADYTCDGTDDQVQIQAAIDNAVLLPSGNNNYSVVLTQGTFNVKAPINLMSGTKVEGMSRDGTIIEINSAFSGASVFKLFDKDVHATELGNFRIEGLGKGNSLKVNGIWYNNASGVFTDVPDTDPDPVHYIHDIYIHEISGNGIVFSTIALPTITTPGGDANTRESVIFNTVVRSAGEHCYWLDGPDSKYLALAGSSAAKHNCVLRGGNCRMADSKMYSGDQHGYYVQWDRGQISNCEAQDIGDCGWYIDSNRTTYVGITADSCGRLAGFSDTHTATNPKNSAFFIDGYNNTIVGQSIARNRGWGTDYIQLYSIYFNSGDRNILEIHSQVSETSYTYAPQLYGGTPKAAYARLSSTALPVNTRFWINNVETTLGGSSGGGGAAWPHLVDYTTEPTDAEYRVSNLYYDGGSSQRDNFEIHTSISPTDPKTKTFWINEWGGMRIQAYNPTSMANPYSINDSLIRLIRGANDRGVGKAIEYLNADRTAGLMSVEWDGKVVAPNVKHLLAIYGLLDTHDDILYSAYAKGSIVVARWLGTGVSDGPLTIASLGPDDTPFSEIATVNAPTISSGYVVTTVPTPRPAGSTGLNFCSAKQAFLDQTSCITRVNYVLPNVTVPSLTGLITGYHDNTKLFSLRLNSSKHIMLGDAADGNIVTGTYTLVDNTEYIIQIKFRQTGTNFVVTATLRLADGTFLERISGSPATASTALLNKFEYGVSYYGDPATAFTARFRNVYVQTGNSDDTETPTATNMSLELATKAYVDNAAGGGLQTRQITTKTTASLAIGASEQGLVTLAPGYRLYKVETKGTGGAAKPARVRLYATDTQRTADASRAEGVVPTGNHGLILDLSTASGLNPIDISPVVEGYDGKSVPDGTIAYTITNTSGAAGAVVVSFTWVQTEALP